MTSSKVQSNTAVSAVEATETSPLISATTSAVPTYLHDTARGRFWAVFSQVLAVQFLGGLDGTILSSSHPVITSYFGVANSASWLSTAFLLALTAVQPLLGRLSDATGRKALFIGCLGIFILATTWCATAGSFKSFVVARAVCGLGAGGAMSLGPIIASDLVPIELRGSYHPYGSIAYGVGCATGAAIGGAMAEILGWRWEFGVQVPLLCVLLGVSCIVIPGDLGVQRHKKGMWETIKRFDTGGSTLLTISTTCFILGLNLGGNTLQWSHPFIITTLSIFVASVPIFIWIESRVAEPIIPLQLLYYCPRANIVYSHFISSLLTNAILFNMPLYFQAVLLTNATSSGLRLMLPSIVSSVTSVVTGFTITSTRRLNWPLYYGAISYLLGTIPLWLLQRDLPPILYLVALIPSAMGQGFNFPGAIIGILSVSAQSEMAVVTSTLLLWRSLGTVLGVALSGLIVQNALVYYLDRYVNGDQKLEVIRLVRSSVEAISRLDHPYQEQVIRSYEAALRLMFACCTMLAAIALCVVIPVRLPRLASRK